jgi:sugar phosphate isomerase/epimerase
MKGISRRTRTCAALAATGVVALAGASLAQAQTRPASIGDGVPTGQGGVQLFNYGGWINNAGGQGSAPPIEATAVSQQCLVDQDPGSADTRTTPACRTERLDALFAFLKRKGANNVELFGHQGFPSNSDTAGLQAYRALLDKHGLHAGGWHGSMSEADWDARLAAAKILGIDYIGSGGFPAPGIQPSTGQNNGYDNTLRTVEALNRLGKRSVEAGVGPVYFHNHQQEFRNRYMDNGVLKTAWQIVMERMDPRYVVAQIDAGWSSDAFDDVTGTQTAALINQFPNSVKLLHIKDENRVAPDTTPLPSHPLACGQFGEPNCVNGQPTALGTGQIDFRPIFTAAANRVEYYFQEHDGGNLTDADVSLTNLKGSGPQVKPAVQAPNTSFDSVPAGTAAANNSKQITIKNVGDAALNITNFQLPGSGGGAPQMQAEESSYDFQVLTNTCVGQSVAPQGTCVVNVGFKPTTSGKNSWSRLIVQSNADNGTETIYLAGSSNASDSLGTIGGTVGSILSLTLGTSASFGSFTPALGRDYDAATSANVVSTAGNAALTVADPDAANPGKLVNGAFALSQPLQVRANTAAFQPLGAAPLSLVSYSGPTAGADGVTVGFRQRIMPNEVLRAGTYGKTLTFTVSTTEP